MDEEEIERIFNKDIEDTIIDFRYSMSEIRRSIKIFLDTNKDHIVKAYDTIKLGKYLRPCVSSIDTNLMFESYKEYNKGMKCYLKDMLKTLSISDVDEDGLGEYYEVLLSSIEKDKKYIGTTKVEGKESLKEAMSNIENIPDVYKFIDKVLDRASSLYDKAINVSDDKIKNASIKLYTQSTLNFFYSYIEEINNTMREIRTLISTPNQSTKKMSEPEKDEVFKLI